MPPLEIRQNRRPGVGAQLRGECRIFEQSDNPFAEYIVIVIGRYECIMHMAKTLRRTGKADDRFACQHVIQELDRMSRAFRSRDCRYVCKRQVTWQILK